MTRRIQPQPADETPRSGLQQRLILALEAAGAGTWDWDSSTGDMCWSSEGERLFGSARQCPTTSSAFLEKVHPADRDHVRQMLTAAMSPGLAIDAEFRIVSDGLERWISLKARASTQDKQPAMLGVFVDVTARHDAEHQLRDLGGRLITAHEQERSRLSRELHDDIGQRLVLISIEFGELRQRLAHGEEDVRLQVDTLSARIRDVASTLHRMSHELHPALIRQIGFERALLSLCSEVGRTQPLTVRCEFSNSGPLIDHDVALGLYRITQEALTNAVKHSGAAEASVSLEASADRIVLKVADNGAGFDLTASREKDSLGLINMRERARLMNGHLTLSSCPGAGTRVTVLVPIAS